MSYARKGLDGSDVYVYATITRGPPAVVVTGERPPLSRMAPDTWVCHECLLMPAVDDGGRSGWEREHFEAPTVAAMIAHLLAHRERGHVVPEAALVRLRGELS